MCLTFLLVANPALQEKYPIQEVLQKQTAMIACLEKLLCLAMQYVQIAKQENTQKYPVHIVKSALREK
jgi:type VI protein secretion system component VasF